MLNLDMNITRKKSEILTFTCLLWFVVALVSNACRTPVNILSMLLTVSLNVTKLLTNRCCLANHLPLRAYCSGFE